MQTTHDMSTQIRVHHDVARSRLHVSLVFGSRSYRFELAPKKNIPQITPLLTTTATQDLSRQKRKGFRHRELNPGLVGTAL
jgi:hypothetical protein